jgi:hypothetical protein
MDLVQIPSRERAQSENPHCFSKGFDTVSGKEWLLWTAFVLVFNPAEYFVHR